MFPTAISQTVQLTSLIWKNMNTEVPKAIVGAYFQAKDGRDPWNLQEIILRIFEGEEMSLRTVF